MFLGLIRVFVQSLRIRLLQKFFGHKRLLPQIIWDNCEGRVQR